MDKFLENQASNIAFQIAGRWNWSKRDDSAKQTLGSEKEVVLRSYSNRPEFAEKFNAALAYYMIRENYIKQSNESAH
jgi:hypothetical protein